MAREVRTAVAQAHRREWSRLLASVVRFIRDLDLAEEAVDPRLRANHLLSATRADLLRRLADARKPPTRTRRRRR